MLQPERRKRHRSRREDTEPPEEGEVGPAPKPKPKVPKMNPLPAAPKPAVQPVDVEMEIDEEEPPPLPTDADGRLELAKEVAAFSQQTQVGVFCPHDVDAMCLDLTHSVSIFLPFAGSQSSAQHKRAGVEVLWLAGCIGQALCAVRPQ